MERMKMAETAAKQSMKARYGKLRKRGVTLTEAAAVLGIFAIVVIGALTLYSTTNQTRLLNQTNSDLNVIQQAIRSIYSGQSDYTGANPAMLVTTKAVPQRMVSGTGLRHAMNGNIDIAPAAVNGTANAGFRITFQNVPVEACAKLLAADLGRNLWASGVGTNPTRTQDAGLPYTPAEAATACQGSSAYQTVSWVFN